MCNNTSIIVPIQMTNGEIDMVPALVESDKPELGKGVGHICQPVRGQGASGVSTSELHSRLQEEGYRVSHIWHRGLLPEGTCI